MPWPIIFQKESLLERGSLQEGGRGGGGESGGRGEDRGEVKLVVDVVGVKENEDIEGKKEEVVEWEEQEVKEVEVVVQEDRRRRIGRSVRSWRRSYW